MMKPPTAHCDEKWDDGGEKSARVLVTLAPKLLAEADGYAKREGISRAELIARGLTVVLTKGRNDRKTG